MAEVFTSDNSPTAAEMDSVAADLQESLEIGEEIEAAHNQKLAGKYNNAEELEKAYLELQSKLGEGDKANPKPELQTPTLTQIQPKSICGESDVLTPPGISDTRNCGGLLTDCQQRKLGVGFEPEPGSEGED